MKQPFSTSLLLAIIICALPSFCLAQREQTPSSSTHPASHKFYWSTGAGGSLLSSALLSKNGGSAKITTPRFTAFFNVGAHLNYDFHPHWGVYTGLNIKNIGFIEKTGNLTIKRRDYTFGIPLGLKIGNVTFGNYVFVGGGIDFPFNYREKSFIKRSQKNKFNEWFSNRTSAVMGYGFLGIHFHPGLELKLQYYPGNFLNPDFTESANGILVKPYSGYKVNLIVLSFGLNIPYRPKEIREQLSEGRNIKEL